MHMHTCEMQRRDILCKFQMHNLAENYVVKSDPKIMSNALLTCNDNTGSNTRVNTFFFIFFKFLFSWIFVPNYNPRKEMVIVILSHNLHALFSSLFLHIKYFFFFSVEL